MPASVKDRILQGLGIFVFFCLLVLSQFPHPFENNDISFMQDADRLDAIGAIGIARTFAFGGERKRPLNDSVQHFHDKLLHLKSEMSTAKGIQLAAERHSLMETFLEALEKELSGGY